ncbi:MAG: hypothetical protein K1X56_07580 [Flavobacteriales bacterium]|nr:hypothetical protein [Flavobacteriales bacterium]
MRVKFGLLSLIVLSALGVEILSSFSTGMKKLPDDEKYKVIKVNGQILVKKSGKPLSTGDELLASTPLDFKTTDSRAAVISPTKGRFVLTAQAETGKTNLVPGMNNVSSRSGALINVIDLKNHFSGDYLILDHWKLKIGNEAFPQSDKNFFFLRFTYNGETINKRLKHDGDSVILERSSIFSIDNKPVDEIQKLECGLYYRKSETNENVSIASFNAIFPALKDLTGEIQIVLDNCASKKTAEKIDEVSAYLNEFYGKTDRDNLVNWMKANLKY